MNWHNFHLAFVQLEQGSFGWTRRIVWEQLMNALTSHWQLMVLGANDLFLTRHIINPLVDISYIQCYLVSVTVLSSCPNYSSFWVPAIQICCIINREFWCDRALHWKL